MSSIKKKKRGRKPWLPKKEVRRNLITSRFTNAELRAITRKAKELKIGRSEVIQLSVRRDLVISQ